eukprot:scaffold7609_cov112-Isochrysis_galbana.AAC.1
MKRQGDCDGVAAGKVVAVGRGARGVKTGCDSNGGHTLRCEQPRTPAALVAARRDTPTPMLYS